MERERTLEIHFTDSLSAQCLVKYDFQHETSATWDEPGDAACVEVTSIQVLTPYVWLPLIGDVEITLSQQHIDKLSEYAKFNGDICTTIEDTLLEIEHDESAS